jgi:hypothetical protein
MDVLAPTIMADVGTGAEVVPYPLPEFPDENTNNNPGLSAVSSPGTENISTISDNGSNPGAKSPPNGSGKYGNPHEFVLMFAT